MEKLLRALPNLQQQDVALTMIEEGFRNAPTTLGTQRIDSFQLWLSEERTRTVANAVGSGRMRKVDCVTLANIVAKWNAPSIKKKYVSEARPLPFPLPMSGSLN